mgnify:CR=1 FL=1
MITFELDASELNESLGALSDRAIKNALRMGMRRTMQGVRGDAVKRLRSHLKDRSKPLGERLKSLRRRVHFETNIKSIEAGREDPFIRARVGRTPEQGVLFDARARTRKGHQHVSVNVLGTRVLSGGFLQAHKRNTTNVRGAVLMRRTGRERGPLAGLSLLSASDILTRTNQEQAFILAAGGRFKREIDDAVRYAVGVATGRISVRRSLR